jgi:hypothetical protein
VVLLLFAIRLTAVALGWDFSPFRYVLPDDPGLRAWLLAAAIVVVGVLVWLVVRHDEERFWLAAGPTGGVLVPVEPLAQLVERAAARHPEVVRAEAGLKVAGASLSGTVRVYGRPLCDPARLAAEVEPLVRRRLVYVTGAEPASVVVKPRVLTVPQLKRYLP